MTLSAETERACSFFPGGACVIKRLFPGAAAQSQIAQQVGTLAGACRLAGGLCQCPLTRSGLLSVMTRGHRADASLNWRALKQIRLAALQIAHRCFHMRLLHLR